MPITEKDNYLMMLRGQQPEWVPSYTFGPMPGGPPVCNCMIGPGFLNSNRGPGGGKDVWGVNYVPTAETGGAMLPEPNNFILDDIRHWRDKIKAPSLEGFNWEEMVKKDLAMYNIDRSQTAIAMNLHVGYFQNLMAFMGFNNGLMSFYEEPDEVKALMEYMCNFYLTVQKNYIDYLNPDIICDMDDTAAWAQPFISPEMFREFILPYHSRQVKVGRDRNLPITFHNCGRCEDFMEDLVGIGVCAWDPAQTSNDLDAVKKKFGNKLCLMGCWDSRGRLLEKDVSDDEIRQSVRDAMDRYAPGGGYAFCGGFLGPFTDQDIMRKNMVLHTEVAAYGKTWYQTHK